MSSSRRWAEPVDLPATGILSADQVDAWRERGFVLVDGLLPADLVERLRREALDVFPSPGTPEAERITDFGSGGSMSFPADAESVNEATLHPRLLGAIAGLLDVSVHELRLTQSDLWAKYGREPRGALDNSDQRIHVDYPNHTLTHPPRWHEPEAVEVILYLSEVAESGGATAVIPRSGDDDPAYAWPIVNTPGVGELPWINDRASAEAWLEREAPDVARWRAEHLYPRERYARFKTGTVLLYRHDTWHRGTPLEIGAMRLAMNLTFRRANSEWISVIQPGWAWGMYRQSRVTERLIAQATPEQRSVLGFPPPGHPYWTQDAIEAVRARYGALGFDAKPYEQARTN